MIGMGDEIRIHVFSLRQEWLFNTFQTNFFRESVSLLITCVLQM